MSAQSAHTLVNQQNGNLSFKVLAFDDNSYFDHIQRNNYFTVVIVTRGSGTARVDFGDHPFGDDTLFAIYPYQPFMFAGAGDIAGLAIQFHHDFFCIHRHQKEIASNGILFNNIYQRPFIQLDPASRETLLHLADRMIAELEGGGLQRDEMIVSYLKIFLVLATRIRLEQDPVQTGELQHGAQLQVLQRLRDAIEANFRRQHAAGAYASLLNLSPAALARIARSHFRRTVGDLIAERIIIEAKRELYLTNKTVKEIAFELGYDDEYYFSRFFKTKTDISPQFYRETVGFNRGEA